jgi:hypothetical protein
MYIKKLSSNLMSVEPTLVLAELIRQLEEGFSMAGSEGFKNEDCKLNEEALIDDHIALCG